MCWPGSGELNVDSQVRALTLQEGRSDICGTGTSFLTNENTFRYRICFSLMLMLLSLIPIFHCKGTNDLLSLM